ncbi:MAG: hypothetical protein IJ877_02575 [Candidatus Gastranaerophilales bacterium]|nr:hypothetical protein [Candidatus Gastranaerophilales bacterium]
MKISNISPKNSTFYTKKNIASTKALINNNKYELSNNTLSEAIGRSQVSFNGKFGKNSLTYTYDSQEPFGNKDHIIYNKEDGSFTIETITKQATIVRHYDPKNSEETITKTTKDYVSFKQNSPQYFSHRKTATDGTVLYSYVLEKSTNNSLEFINDEDLKRQIIIRTENGRKDVRIRDLETNSYVYSGEKAWIKETDEEAACEITKNAITDVIVRKESLSNGTDYFLEEYYEDTGYLAREVYYDKAGELFCDVNYDRYGNILSRKMRTRNKKIEEYIQYAQNGSEEIHTKKYFDRRGNIARNTTFYPNTDKIQKDLLYNQDTIEEINYNRYPNRALSSHIYDKAEGTLLEETNFYEDGTTPKTTITYRNSGFKVKTSYSRNGFPKILEKYTSTDFLVYVEEYRENSAIRAKTTRINPLSQTVTSYEYDNTGEFPVYKFVYDKDGNIIESAYYYPHSDNVNVKYEFKDGYKTEYVYSRDGHFQGSKKEKYRIEKQYDSETDFKIFTGNNLLNEPGISKEERKEILEKISSVLGSAVGDYSSITKKEWQVVLEALELDELAELEKMDKSLYRKLAKKCHNDLHQDDPSKENDCLFNIISYFHDKNSKIA